MNISALIALAVAPCVAIALFVYLKDTYEKEPLRLLAKLYLFGAAVTLPVGLLQAHLLSRGFGAGFELSSEASRAFVTAGIFEEGAKLAVVLLVAYRSAAFNEPFDGIVYATMASMGFATAENILYVVQGGMSVGLVRMFTAVPAHGTFGVVMGYYIGRSKFHNGKVILIAAGYFGAAALHGTYDFFLMVNDYPFLAIGGLFSLVGGIAIAFRAMKESSRVSPFRKSLLDKSPTSSLDDPL